MSVHRKPNSLGSRFFQYPLGIYDATRLRVGKKEPVFPESKGDFDLQDDQLKYSVDTGDSGFSNRPDNAIKTGCAAIHELNRFMPGWFMANLNLKMDASLPVVIGHQNCEKKRPHPMKDAVVRIETDDSDYNAEK